MAKVIAKSLLVTFLPVCLAFLGGAVLPFQAAVNASAGRLLGYSLWGALASLTVSSLVIIIALVVLRAPAPDFGRAFQGGWWLWTGGVLGAIYVGGAASLTPTLGSSGFLLLVVLGQIIASVLVDHFGLMGLAARPMSFAKALGIILIIVGVIAVQRCGEN